MTKTSKTKKRTGAYFDLTATIDFLHEKYYTVSINFKICISQIVTKMELKQQNLIQIRLMFGRTYSNLKLFSLIKMI